MRIIDTLQNPAFTSKNVLEKLICYKLKISKETLFTDSDREIDPLDYERITHSYDDYHDNKKPLEYIVGFVEFLGVRFEVTPATLIPRPETEYMIEAVGDLLQNSSNASFANENKVTIIDVGTGCGVLGLSVLRHNQPQVKEVFLSELSMEALDVAKKNYEILCGKNSTLAQTPVTFLESDLVAHPTLVTILQSDQPTILVANLPYIPDQTFDENVEDNVKKREPRMAFVGGNDGLDLYRRMFDQIIEARKTSDTPFNGSSNNFVMFLEMMTRQVDILRSEYEKIFTFEEVKTFHFNIRIVKATLQ